MIARAALIAGLLLAASCARSGGEYPARLDPGCRDGRAKVYDQCSDQRRLFAGALSEANATGKTLLVSMGAEWCVWCHVFKRYIDGEAGDFTYVYGVKGEPDKWSRTARERQAAKAKADGRRLRDFVRGNFVVVHIDYEFAPGGLDVVSATGADAHFDDWIPFVFAVDAEGRFAAALAHSAVGLEQDDERDWFRGYDRAKLQAELATMRAAATAASPAR